MLIPNMSGGKSLKLTDQEQALLKLFRQLPEREQNSLLDQAAFLASRVEETAEPPVVARPQVAELLPRPEKESVIAAIKRLSASYPMVDKGRMLNETSGLMTAHLLQGRPAPEVIDDLQQLFAREYQIYLDDFSEPSA